MGTKFFLSGNIYMYVHVPVPVHVYLYMLISNL